MNGVVSKQLFSIIRNNPEQPQSIVTQDSEALGGCCYSLYFLAETGAKTNDLYNDKFSELFFLDNFFTAGTLYLIKDDTDEYVLNDDTYGTYYAYGYGGVSIYDDYRFGYCLDFNKVINELGTGKYQIRCDAESIIATTVQYYSFSFCLYEYSQELANETVRFDYYKNGNEGTTFNDSIKRDFGTLNWYNSIRINSASFGKPTSELTKQYVKYQNGKQVWVSDNLEFEYNLKLNSIPYWLAEYIATFVNVNSEMYVTDYNLINEVNLQQKGVTATSSFKPEYTDGANVLDCTFTYKPLTNNYNHFRG